MPIILKVLDWSQTDSLVRLNLPLPKERGKVDIFKTSKYFKLSFPTSHSLFELFWPEPVRPESGRCVFRDDEAQIFVEFVKEDAKLWNTLTADLSKEEKQRIKSESIEEYQNREVQRCQDLLRQERERDRQAIAKSIEEDKKRREKIAEAKEEAKRKFLYEHDDNRVKANQTSKLNLFNNPFLEPVDEETQKVMKARFEAIKAYKEKRKKTERLRMSLETKLKMERSKKENLPPPRSFHEIILDFSPSRVDKYHERFSKNVQRDEVHKDDEESAKGVQKNIERVPKVKDVELDKEFLLKKGSELFKENNIAESIEIFSHGIKQFPKHAAFYNNRAACYLKVNHDRGVLEDTSIAIDLLKDHDDDPECVKQLTKAHLRRAAALKDLGLDHEAVGELEAAAVLAPEIESIREDIERLKERQC